MIRILALMVTIFVTAQFALAQNWVTNGAPNNIWSSIASSADGTKLVAAAGSSTVIGSIYTSTNSGLTWTKSTNAPKTN
jgi:hypothetical protein